MAPAQYGTTEVDVSAPARSSSKPWLKITAATALACVAVVALSRSGVKDQAADFRAIKSGDAIGELEGGVAVSTGSSRPHIVLVTLVRAPRGPPRPPVTKRVLTVCALCLPSFPQDDVGWNDFGSQSTDLSEITPHMTRLADDGVKLTGYYGQSLCTPARASLHSGKFAHRTGFNPWTISGGWTGIEILAYSNYSVPIANRLLAQRLSEDAGYATMFAGKWNIGHCADAYLPWNRGYDYFMGYFTSGIDYTTHEPDELGTYTLDGETKMLRDFVEGDSSSGLLRTGASIDTSTNNYTDQLLSSAASSQIQAHVDMYGADAGHGATPLFVHMAFHGPHDDAGADETVQADLLARTAAAADGRGAAAVAALSALEDEVVAGTNSTLRINFARALMATDGAFSEVIETLNSTGMLDAGTVVVMASDNGGWPCGKYSRGSNAPLRGSKFYFSEGALRVPAFVWTSRSGAAEGLLRNSARGSSYSGMMHHVDWLPTLGALAGAATDDDAGLDGLDQWAAISRAAAPTDSPRDEIVFALTAQYWVIRSGNYKLLGNMPNASWYGDSLMISYADQNADTCMTMNTVMSELYDVEADEEERHNLANDVDYKGIVTRLQARATALYGQEFYVPTHAYNTPLSAQTPVATVFDEAGGYIVPWQCEVQ